MKHEDLSSEKIAEALSFLDYEDREEWFTAAFALKSELGESGFNHWVSWSQGSSTFKLANAKAVWKSASGRGGVTIGTLIFLAMQRGFKIGESQPISNHVRKERAENRAKAEAEAAAAEIEKSKKQSQKAITAKSMYAEFAYAENHNYLDVKQILPHGIKVGKWTYKDENEDLVTEQNALIIPLYFDGEIVSLQAIMPNGTKKMMAGAKKSGTYYPIGDQSKTEKILICEGFATGATLHESTQMLVFVAFDSGNLKNVAKMLRKKYPLARIIVCADNDQYKRSNTGIKTAIKVCCEIDADLVYPKFPDIRNRPTDFNDLCSMSGPEVISTQINEVPQKYFAESKPKLLKLSAFDLEYIDDAEKIYNESNSEILVARAGLVTAMRLSKEVPAFRNIESIRKHLDHPLISPETHLSIMCRVQWSIFSRKRIALTTIKPESWGNKHDFQSVSSLSDVVLTNPVTLVAAPMGAGKTKRVIKPFSEKSVEFVAIAHRRSLIADLADGLGIASYDDIKTPDQAMESKKIAICLPSTQSNTFRDFVNGVPSVAIDEISQNIRFTASKECKVMGASQDVVFSGLQKIISKAENVIACDASIDQTTLSFFEKSRPDERFTIVEQPPIDTGRKCFLYDGRDDFLAKIDEELMHGGNVWLAVESAEKAEVLSMIFGEKYNAITITSRNSKTKKVSDFLNNIEQKSREYRIVIASPAISSGVSVEHQKLILDEDGRPEFVSDPHFTMIAGMASGHSICFSDFAQMLGRVRYVADYHIYLQNNNKRNEFVNAQSIVTGLRQAAAMEGTEFKETLYTRFKAHIDATEEMHRSDFACGLVWFLEYFCFSVKKGGLACGDYSLSDKMKDLTAEAKEKYRKDIIAAACISNERAQVLEKLQSLDDQQFFELLAFKIRISFNFELNHELSETDIDFFERLPSVDRFAAMIGLSRGKDETKQNIALRRFEDARIKATAEIFNGVDLYKITSEDCDKIIERVSLNRNRFMLSALKLVPSAYGQWLENNKGELKQYPIPSKTGKPVAAILDKFGLKWSRSSQRMDGKIENYYKISEDEFALNSFYANSRFKQAEIKISEHSAEHPEVAAIRKRLGMRL